MAEEVRLIKMRREEPSRPGGPTTADVHPDEEANYAAAGWARAEDPEADARARAEAEAKARAEAEAAAKAKAAAGGAGGELSLEQMKRPQLIVEAEKVGVTLLPGMSNAAAVAAIKDAMVKRAAEFLNSQEQPQSEQQPQQ